MLDILVVDDNQRNLTAIEAAIGDLTPNLEMVTSGETALKLLLERDFSLILLDVQMPGLDGLETARLIRSRERSRGIPIIFVTAYEQSDQAVLKGYELGAVDYLFKPVVTDVLRAKVNVFVDLRRQAERLRHLERQAYDHRLNEERHAWEARSMERQMEEQRRINQELEAAHEKKNEFIAMLGHELRNPLSPVLSTLELMKLEGLQEPRLVEARNTAERQVRHLIRLVDDLLDIARIDRGKLELQLEERDLRDAVRQAVETVRDAAQARAQTIHLDLPEEPVWARVDHARIVQVVGNLLNNAVRYGNDGGRVEVTLASAGGRGSVEVRDDGPGIDPSLLEDVFDMFVQASSGGQGLGLGLSLVRRLVAMHDGEVVARSEGQGRGCCFRIELPLLTEERGDTLRSKPPTSKVDPSRAARIVLIDDDEDIRLLTQTLLERLGHEVVVAPDGRLGIDTIMEARPDVAIVDIGLPDISGVEVAKTVTARLEEQRPYLVAVTGYGSEDHREAISTAGFDAHIVKPASLEQLTETIAHGLSLNR